MVEGETWVEACRLDALSSERCTLVTLDGLEVGLLLHAGQPVAVVNNCPHFGGPLAQGPVSTARGEIICPWHRFRFDLATGRSVTNPAMAAPLLRTDVRDGTVWVDLSGSNVGA
ncbi:MAG TPA: Rieske 2Fe-2S domain-containing protein [Chloroflexota bacterium]|nr:Rieske 2Fe-2S domain-containing protein [Chloroflexota bacterium]